MLLSEGKNVLTSKNKFAITEAGKLLSKKIYLSISFNGHTGVET